jgi:preprotein translocase subunit SecG
MEAIVLVVHLLLAVALVGVVLLQRSEGGGLGIGGGGGGGMGGFMTTRGTANLLTRTTAILAAAFMCTSLLLALLAGTHQRPTSIIDTLPAVDRPAPAAPSAPQSPAAPLR